MRFPSTLALKALLPLSAAGLICALACGGNSHGSVTSYAPVSLVLDQDDGTGTFVDTLLVNPWGIAIGPGANEGDPAYLYYAAAPGDEQHGIFGYLTVN